MTTIIIILVTLTFWYLSGFLGKRPINPKNNRWHAWGPFNQIWGWIDGDKPSFLPYSMPWPFNAVYRHLTYTKYVEDGKIAADKVKSADGKDIIYHEAQKIEGIKKPIRVVEEEVTRLRKTEVHPYVVTAIMPKSGFTFFLNITAKIEVLEPMDTLKLDEFLVFIGNELHDAVFPWAVGKEKDWVAVVNSTDQSIIADTVIDEMTGLKIDDVKSILIETSKNVYETLYEYLNNKIEPFGLKNGEFSLDVGYDENVKNILNKRKDQKAEIEENLLQEKKSLTRVTVRNRELADGKQEILLDKQRLDDVQKPAMAAYGKMKAKENGAWKEGVTLFMGNDSTNSQTALLAGILKNTKKGGSDATQPTT